jgi:heme/copper-type cytochrome/quinol oxidase subunit 2
VQPEQTHKFHDPILAEMAAAAAATDATMAAGEVVEALDHPIFFSIVITIVVVAWMAIFTWAFKAANLPGPAALFQHP